MWHAHRETDKIFLTLARERERSRERRESAKQACCLVSCLLASLTWNIIMNTSLPNPSASWKMPLANKCTQVRGAVWHQFSQSTIALPFPYVPMLYHCTVNQFHSSLKTASPKHGENITPRKY